MHRRKYLNAGLAFALAIAAMLLQVSASRGMAGVSFLPDVFLIALFVMWRSLRGLLGLGLIAVLGLVRDALIGLALGTTSIGALAACIIVAAMSGNARPAAGQTLFLLGVFTLVALLVAHLLSMGGKLSGADFTGLFAVWLATAFVGGIAIALRSLFRPK